MNVTDAEFLTSICRENFSAFCAKAFQFIEPGSDYDFNWHLECIAEHLEAVYRGELRRLIINVPPRTLKSVQVAQMYPAWVMGKEPHHQFIGAAYAHSLAERNVMKTRQIMSHEWYKDAFPKTFISRDQNQKDFFTTTQAGQYKGTGIGGAITGFGCHTLIIDDPINPREAGSDTIRLTANEEIKSTLFSRFNKRDEGKLIMIMQRLHEADPTGELMRMPGYHLLKLPAEAKTHIVVKLNDMVWEMKEGELLTPRLPKDELDMMRTHEMGEYNYAGQYMQEPVPVGGGEFKDGWIQHYPQGGIKPKEMNVVILVDPAGGEELNKKKKKLSDWTAFIVVGLAPDNNYYLLDMIRDRLNPTDRIDTLFMLHRKWNEICGKPPKVGYEKYGMMTDTHYIKEKKKQDAYNFPVIELGGQMGKEERIRRLIPDMQNNRWYFPDNLIYIDCEGRKFDLVQEIINSEMKTFPRARHDDMIDALSRIYEADLHMVFPKPRVGMVEKAVRVAAAQKSEDWADW